MCGWEVRRTNRGRTQSIIIPIMRTSTIIHMHSRGRLCHTMVTPIRGRGRPPHTVITHIRGRGRLCHTMITHIRGRVRPRHITRIAG